MPDYAAIGVAAPILLSVLRMIQGFAVGGESAIANVFMIENAPPGRRALSGAIGGAGYAVGIQLASLTALACANFLTSAELQSWGWRIPFWISAVVVLAGLIIRSRLEETPEFKAERPAMRSTSGKWLASTSASGDDRSAAGGCGRSLSVRRT